MNARRATFTRHGPISQRRVNLFSMLALFVSERVAGFNNYFRPLRIFTTEVTEGTERKASHAKARKAPRERGARNYGLATADGLRHVGNWRIKSWRTRADWER